MNLELTELKEIFDVTSKLEQAFRHLKDLCGKYIECQGGNYPPNNYGSNEHYYPPYPYYGMPPYHPPYPVNGNTDPKEIPNAKMIKNSPLSSQNIKISIPK